MAIISQIVVIAIGINLDGFKKRLDKFIIIYQRCLVFKFDVPSRLVMTCLNISPAKEQLQCVYLCVRVSFSSLQGLLSHLVSHCEETKCWTKLDFVLIGHT